MGLIPVATWTRPTWHGPAVGAMCAYKVVIEKRDSHMENRVG